MNERRRKLVPRTLPVDHCHATSAGSHSTKASHSNHVPTKCSHAATGSSDLATAYYNAEAWVAGVAASPSCRRPDAPDGEGNKGDVTRYAALIRNVPFAF